MQSLLFRVTLLILLCTLNGTQGQSLNLSTIFDNRLVHKIRQATSALAQKPQSDRNLTKILQSLEIQNARLGDACDRSAWSNYMKPIYEALFKGHFALQKNENDNFAVAILKNPKVMTMVCMSTTEVLECHENGKCDCLTILPPDLKGAPKCELRMSGDSGSGDGGGTTITGNVLGFFKNLFAPAASGTESVGRNPHVTIIALFTSVTLIYFILV